MLRATGLRTAYCRLCGYLLKPGSAGVGTLSNVTALGTQRSITTGSVLLTTKGEREITKILTEKLSPSYVDVRDISGGCGSMYEIWIDSERFSGKRLIQQHRMVNEALGDDVVKSLHGLTIKIGNPKKSEG